MKKSVLTFGAVVALLCCLVGEVAYAQVETQLIYKERGRNQVDVQIYFSDQNGSSEIGFGDFSIDPNLYFTVIPGVNQDRNYFKEGDISDDIPAIKLFQNGIEIQKTSLPRPVPDSDGKFGKIILEFPKNQLKLYQPIVFISPFDTASPISLPDKYYNYYEKYHEIYSQGIELSDNGKYRESFKKLMTILNDVERYEEINYYSFYPHASESLIVGNIINHTDSLGNALDHYKQNFLQNKSQANLQKCDSIINLINTSYDLFVPYFEMGFPEGENLKTNFLEIVERANKESELNNKLFSSEKLSFFKDETYGEYKYDLFITLITHLLTQLDSLKIIDGIEPIDIDNLSHLPFAKAELEDLNYYNEFEIMIDLINKSITEHGMVFSDSTIMGQLQNQKRSQKQPYFEIFNAFNTLDNNLILFKQLLVPAIEQCSDSTLISNLEYWILSSRCTLDNTDSQLITNLNRGYELIEERKWDAAENILKIITKQAVTLSPPWYYWGVIDYNKGEIFSSDNKLQQALDRYPKYIAPRVSRFRILYEEESFGKLIEEIDNALVTNDIWLYHFWKARAYYAMGKYRDVVAEIQDNCRKKNEFDIEQYFLLGDAYLNLGKYNEAEEAYRKTQEIDPFNDETYNQRMLRLDESRRN